MLCLTCLSHAGDTKGLTVSATVLTNGSCKFRTVPAPLNFGAIDPANANDITTSTTIDFRCAGSVPNGTYDINQNDGLYSTGPHANRMRHTTVLTAYLPYTLTISPFTGNFIKNVTYTATISATVAAANYQNAYAGSYSDTVVISIAP
jgi:hypothetical protein